MKIKSLKFGLLLLTVFLAVFIYLAYKKGALNFSKINIINGVQPTSSIESDEEKLAKKVNEKISLENNKNFEKAYDDIFSPESKQRLSKDKYIELGEVYYNLQSITITINNIIIKNNIGYVDTTAKRCKDVKCVEERYYKKYIKIDNEWFYVYETTPTYCIRETPYDMPEEFQRALSIITQRYENQGKTEMADSFKNIRNCLKIEYAETGKEMNGAEGFFMFSPSHSLDEYLIKVSPKYSIKDDLITALLLRHELTHVLQYADNVSISSSEECYKAEANAFVAVGNFLYHVLNQEEQKSLSSRFNKSPEVTQTYNTIVNIAMSKGELIDERALNYVKSSTYYQKQCNNNE